MKAIRHITAAEKKRLREIVEEMVQTERADISQRAQYQWGMAMLQAGLSPRTVRRVMDHLPAVAQKYMEYQTEKLGDLFMRSVLADAGVEMPETEKPI